MPSATPARNQRYLVRVDSSVGLAAFHDASVMARAPNRRTLRTWNSRCARSVLQPWSSDLSLIAAVSLIAAALAGLALTAVAILRDLATFQS
jgi:hypothetical protein